MRDYERGGGDGQTWWIDWKQHVLALSMLDMVVRLSISVSKLRIRLGCNGLAVDMVKTAKLLSMWWLAQPTELNLVERAISSCITHAREWYVNILGNYHGVMGYNCVTTRPTYCDTRRYDDCRSSLTSRAPDASGMSIQIPRVKFSVNFLLWCGHLEEHCCLKSYTKFPHLHEGAWSSILPSNT
jgi:hypothetical protein